ncbi:MAG: carbohydrate porin [Elusimicrobiota bacterium]|nr:carbohydrate porin [Elusimicrobiota bacterium]
MNKKIIAALVAALLVAGGNSSSLLAGGLADDLGIKISGNAIFILQGTPKLNDGSDKKHSGSYTFNLKFIKELENNAKIVFHLDGGEGSGLPGQTYAWINGDADSSYDPDSKEDGNAYTKVRVYYLYYQQAFLDEKLTLNFGKLNHASFFDNNEYANDEESQFVTGTFVVNQGLYTQLVHGRHLGFRAKYDFNEKLDFSYAYFSSDVDDFASKGTNIAQITLKPAETGNYRFWYAGDNTNYAHFDNANKSSGGYGFGLSFDQQIKGNFGLFARASYFDPNVYVQNLEYSIGGQISGASWDRERDKLAIAVGKVTNSDKIKEGSKDKNYTDNSKGYKNGTETQVEIYYNIGFTDNLTLSPIFQYFANPKGGNAAIDEDIVVYGIRTQFNF